jgi:hypothetical protein
MFACAASSTSKWSGRRNRPEGKRFRNGSKDGTAGCSLLCLAKAKGTAQNIDRPRVKRAYRRPVSSDGRAGLKLEGSRAGNGPPTENRSESAVTNLAEVKAISAKDSQLMQRTWPGKSRDSAVPRTGSVATVFTVPYNPPRVFPDSTRR